MRQAKAPQRALLAAILLAAPAMAQDSPKAAQGQKEVESGSGLFGTYCATCHGTTAKGDGPLASQLRVRPPDLTLLARQNKGQWDGERVARVIDGRTSVKGHGGPDMPVWGDVFKNSRDKHNDEGVKERVQALRDYIESLQAPPEKP